MVAQAAKAKKPAEVIAPKADMEPAEARRLLRRCDRADSALLDVETAIETGDIFAQAAVTLYARGDNREDDRGNGAQLRGSHWKRIVADGQRDGFWSTGNVSLAATEADRSVEMRGIRLNRPDVLEFASRYNVPETTSTPSRPRKTGPEPKYAEWDDFWTEVVRLAQDRKLHQGYFRSQTKLMATLLEKMAPGSLSSHSIEPRVAEIWATFVEGK